MAHLQWSTRFWGVLEPVLAFRQQGCKCLAAQSRTPSQCGRCAVNDVYCGTITAEKREATAPIAAKKVTKSPQKLEPETAKELIATHVHEAAKAVVLNMMNEKN